MSSNVFLCGLSGSGKSSVAPLLARLRESDALDTDAMIVAEAGLSIAEIFEREGETGFRTREARAVAAACERSNCVVALGGGALEWDDSHARVLQSGLLIFLDATDDVLRARLHRTGEFRPLLAAPAALQRMRERRLVRYRSAALAIDTSSLTPEQVAVRINDSLAQARTR